MTNCHVAEYSRKALVFSVDQIQEADRSQSEEAESNKESDDDW